MLTIERIEENARVEYTGDVRVTGSIGRNAHVIIKDGSLIVAQHIEANAKIRLYQEENNASINLFGSSIDLPNTAIGMGNSIAIARSGGIAVVSGDSIAVAIGDGIAVASGGGKAIAMNTAVCSNIVLGGRHIRVNTSSIKVCGNVGNGVTISSNKGNIIVSGRVGRECVFETGSGAINVYDVENNSRLNTGSGPIKGRNFSDNCSLNTGSGPITAANFGTHCSLKTGSGPITAANFGPHCSLFTNSGDIKVQSIDPSVSIQTGSGDIYERGIKRQKAKTKIFGGISGINNAFFVNSNSYRTSSSSDANSALVCTYKAHPMTDISMMVLGGFLAVIGIVAIALAIAVLNAATFNTLGLIVTGLGCAATITGGSLLMSTS